MSNIPNTLRHGLAIYLGLWLWPVAVIISPEQAGAKKDEKKAQGKGEEEKKCKGKDGGCNWPLETSERQAASRRRTSDETELV